LNRTASPPFITGYRRPVVLDLMIHDNDLILDLKKAP
jgi:hypothetical protein